MVNETIEGRAPGGHGGDANGDREGVIRLVSNKHDFVRRLITLSRARNQAWFNSVGNQAHHRSPPFSTGQGGFGLHSQTTNKLSPLGPAQKDLGCLSTERRTKARSPTSQRVDAPPTPCLQPVSAKGTTLSNPPHQSQDNHVTGLRILETVGKAVGHNPAGSSSNGTWASLDR